MPIILELVLMQYRSSATRPACAPAVPPDGGFLDLYSSLEGFDGDVERLSYVSHNCYRGQTILPVEDVPF